VARERVELEAEQQQQENERQLVAEIKAELARVRDQGEQFDRERAIAEQRARQSEQNLVQGQAELAVARTQLDSARQEIARLAAAIAAASAASAAIAAPRRASAAERVNTDHLVNAAQPDVEPIGDDAEIEPISEEEDLELIDDAGVIALLTLAEPGPIVGLDADLVGEELAPMSLAASDPTNKRSR
jgi:septal ring factor EnvC (AmiA/AmiB activator)